MTVDPTPLSRYLQVLIADAAPGRLVEIRYRTRRGMGQSFIPAKRPAELAERIRQLARTRDTYVGVLLRDRESGGRQAVPDGHLIWAEVDARAAAELLGRAPAPPTLTVASGTPGHLHAYWRLGSPASREHIEAANRRLAHAVGGDFASVDMARILRPPDTWNYKTHPPREVRLQSLSPQRVYDLDALVAGLADPQPPATLSPPAQLLVRRGDGGLAERLRGVPAEVYVPRLCGRTPDRDGKLLCPFHEERTASLQVYPDGSWCCFGCRRGGSIVDFAAALWGLGTKGRDFIEVRERLISEFLGGRAVPVSRPQITRRGLPGAHSSTSKEISR